MWVSALGELEPTSPQAAFKGVIAGSSVKSVVTSALADVMSSFVIAVDFPISPDVPFRNYKMRIR